MDWRIFYNPLAVLGKWRGLITSIVVVVVLGVVAYWGQVHVGEALVPRITPDRPSAGVLAAESLIAWLSLGVLFFLMSKTFGGNSGVGAHLGAAGLGRLPYIVAVVILSRGVLGDDMLRVKMPTEAGVVVPPQEIITPAVIAGIISMFVVMAWAVIILYLGFSYASRLPRVRAIPAFIVSIALAQLISYLLAGML